MTASEPNQPGDRPLAGSDGRPLAERALDLLVYAPAGLLLTASEDFSEVTARGRARVAQEVRNARVVGRFAVDFGWRQVARQIESLAAASRAREEDKETTVPERPRRAPRPGGPAGSGQPGAPAAGRARPAPDAAVDRAIPGYDALSASQVARRLDGLSTQDLRAVVRHEAAGRGRRTVLNRAEQLLGAAPPPDTSATS